MIKKHTLGPNKLYVEEHLPEEKSYESPLVFVHGSFGGFWMWNMIVPALVKHGFHCVTFSLRGHKPSGGTLEGTGMSDYADDLKTVISELNLENPVVVGHSMSGLVVLIYAAKNPVRAVISIGPSPSVEVQGAGDEEVISKIPDVYNALEAGLPMDPTEVMKVLPDIPQEMLMKMREMLGGESGTARRDRKRGVSVPKESITAPTLFMGSEHGDSVDFGVSFEKTKKMSEYYGGELFGVKGATHPGILMGKHSGEVTEKITSWLQDK